MLLCFAAICAASLPAGAAGANQVRNGEMVELTNGALTYWSPRYVSGCDDNTIAQSTSNSLSIGGRRLARLSGHGNQYAVIRSNSASVVPFEAAMEQLILLPNGTYTLSAYVASLITEADIGQGAYAKAAVYANDGAEAVELQIDPTTAQQAPWVRIEIPGITVTNGKCRISFAIKSVASGTNAQAGRALAVDAVEIAAQGAAVVGGAITKPDGSAAPYSKVEAFKGGAPVASASTGSTDGAYSGLSVPVGAGYEFRATNSAFEPVILANVDVASEDPLTLDFQFAEASQDAGYEYGYAGGGYGAEGGAYYFDAAGGDDANDGRTPETAWRTVAKFNATEFQPGDTVLFSAGGVWTGAALIPRGNGEEGRPIVVGKYGDAGSLPAFHRNYIPGTPLESMSNNNTGATLQISGVSYWEFNDLEITNYGVYNADNAHSAQAGRAGVSIVSMTAQPDATMRGIRLNGLYIHDVNGANPKSGGGYNSASGVGISWSANGQSRIDGLVIENCLLKNIMRNGITGGGYDGGGRPWGHNSWDAQGPNAPLRHLNVAVRNNVLDTIAGDGILVGGTLLAVVERNLVTRACNDPRPYPSLSGNATSNLSAAVWPFDADGTVFQYNEVCYTRVPRGTEVADGEAFDSDYYCTNSLYQYNYTHDNEGGFFMVCGPEYSYTDGSVVRYNISENDGSIYGKRTIFEIGGGGGVNRTNIYNNTIYVGPGHSVFSVMRGEPWDGKPKGTVFANNIFFIDGDVAEFGWAGDPRDKGLASVASYDSNLYYGRLFDTAKDVPDDPHAVFGDPALVRPGGAGDGYGNAVAYKLSAGSAAIGAGASVDIAALGQRLAEDLYSPGNSSSRVNKAEYFHIVGPDFEWKDVNGGLDFFGNALPADSPIDIGAHQFSSESNGAGNSIAISVSETGVVTAEAKYAPGEGQPESVTLILALYDAGRKLVAISTAGAAAPPYGLSASLGRGAATYAEAFLWDSDSYVPAMPSERLELPPS
jgi:hypothetical protein